MLTFHCPQATPGPFLRAPPSHSHITDLPFPHRQYSGVSTLSFLKHITTQELTLAGLRALGPVVETLAAAEGLDGHKMAVTVRLNELGRTA